MLERIETVKGIGLLHEAIGKPHKFEKSTLIYADNGRGKSTLTTILTALSAGDASSILACRTVDGINVPEVALQFSNGHQVTFHGETWSEPCPEFLVFDADFINRNVHSGGAVRTDHRMHLLEFALGDPAVKARRDVESATSASQEATQEVQDLQRTLSGYQAGITLAQFEKLTPVPDADTQIDNIQTSITAAKNIAAIQAKPTPECIPEPEFNIDDFFSKLALSVSSVHEEAEALVKQHIADLGGKGVETWLSQGRQFANGPACPYCNQDVSNSDLVRAYQAHFDEAYANLKTKVAALGRNVAAKCAPSVVEGAAQSIAIANARCTAWSEYFALAPITFDRQNIAAALSALREFVGNLVARKQLAPVEPVGTPEDQAKTVALWEQVLEPIRAANDAIRAANDTIKGYKAQLTAEGIEHLQERLQHVRLAKARYDPTVVDLIEKLSAARGQVKTANQKKKAARESLDRLMEATLSKYQSSVNDLLAKFEAAFRIDRMSANFRGHAPRAEYGLRMRGKSISVESDSPPFAKALSDGDKRTLAFAFFVACAAGDPKLEDRIVVIDDPMCSLDRNRRHDTIGVLRKLSLRTAQLIVLAHDAYFLRDLRDGLRKDDKARRTALIQLAVAPNQYTNFGSLDLDKECESSFAKQHRLLTEFACGNGGDPDSVAAGIRILLEDYLHRRFPGFLPEGAMFGQMLDFVRDAKKPSPLCFAQNLVEELRDINDYAWQFHHGTKSDPPTKAATPGELLKYVNRALLVVHGGTPAPRVL